MLPITKQNRNGSIVTVCQTRMLPTIADSDNSEQLGGILSWASKQQIVNIGFHRRRKTQHPGADKHKHYSQRDKEFASLAIGHRYHPKLPKDLCTKISEAK